MNSDEIRESFLSYFESKGHLRVASSSLIPIGDPTLLLTTAGMVQFKPYFAGESTPPNRRLSSSQKSFRAVDIDEVGDATHLTLFEMLGNFSIGDYFKEGAVHFALECFTEVMDLPRESFAATVHHSDDETFELWQKAGIPAERIFRFGDEDNWWGPAGLEGPTGPCAELHYDFGAGRGCLQPDCGPNCTNPLPGSDDACNRFVELWNLVFMQFYHHLDGTRTPLPFTGIDTGMGLERLAVVMQDARDIYDTDLFRPLIERVEDIAEKEYGADRDDDYAMRVVSEHARSAAFLIADGVVPANEGRGYVLRRVVRRAIRFGRRLGLEDPFLGEMARVVIGTMGQAYRELRDHQEFVLTVLELEEKKFQQVFENGNRNLGGMIGYREVHRKALSEVSKFARKHNPGAENAGTLLEQHGFAGYHPDADEYERQGHEAATEVISALLHAALEGDCAFTEVDSWGTTLSGREAFFLHDTYGFPVEITQEIARERGLEVDIEGFEREMEAQRQRGRAAARFGGDRSKIRLYESMGVGSTAFLGYDTVAARSVVVGLISGDQAVDSVADGASVDVFLLETPFYPEGGGQVGDAGVLAGPGGRIDVHDTQTVMPGLIAHFGKVAQGEIAVGDTLDAHVDPVRRQDTARNHTATHMLHAALRQVLGPHVRQAGSLVAPDRLRFDFSHVEAVTGEEMEQVQWLVNEKIRENVSIHRSEDTYAQAVERGALAFFGDKYDDTVRLIEIANGATFSFEVCGGTHVHRTGELGAVYVLGESSIGSGLRRIEAVSGRGAERVVRDRFSSGATVATLLNTSVAGVEERVKGLLEELDAARRANEVLERRASAQSAHGLLDLKQDVDGVTVLASSVEASNVDAMRDMGDWLRDKLGSGVVVLGAVIGGRPVLVAMVTPDLVSRGHSASDIVKGAAKAIGGGGGGRPDVAQAGGRRADGLEEALGLVHRLVGEKEAGL